MTFNEMYLLITILSSNYCLETDRNNFENCVEEIRECYFDGESFLWCANNFKGEQ